MAAFFGLREVVALVVFVDFFAEVRDFFAEVSAGWPVDLDARDWVVFFDALPEVGRVVFFDEEVLLLLRGIKIDSWFVMIER